MSNGFENTFEVGTVLDNKWVILGLIGRGGMGEVYRAHQLNLDRDVAIKVISQKWLKELCDSDYESETALERFRREVRIMAQVRHPNVLQIFDHGSASVGRGEEDVCVEYIVMEYIPGATLRSTMSIEGLYPEEDRMQEWLSAYFLPLLDGVRALHELGIVHRDLKPENVLLDGGTPKIADFGMASSCRLKPVTQSMDMRGTPSYMSPEHFMDLKRTDQRTDVYALGKILYEAASGKIQAGEIPFKKASLKKAETPFYQELDRIVQVATVEERNERFPSAEVFKRSIEELLGKTTGVASPFKRAVEKVQHRSFLLLLAVVLLVAGAVIGLGIFFFHESSHPPTHDVQPPPPQSSQMQEPGKDTGTPSASPSAASQEPNLQGEDYDIMRLIPGGEITLPKSFGTYGGKTMKVDPFYLNEAPITNSQYVSFLNQVLPRIKVENGVVMGDGEIWLLLGEVTKGYEPIVFEDGKFHVRNALYAANPVLRVTVYGAQSYVRFFGQRLPTEVEWLYALAEGGRNPGTHPEEAGASSGMSEDTCLMPNQTQTPGTVEQVFAALPTPVTLLKPNAYGIRGLNENIGEWGVRSVEGSPGIAGAEHVVLGGPMNNSDTARSTTSAVRRLPWEAFEEVGFRCALSAPNQKE